jgi:hypothetical protein
MKPAENRVVSLSRSIFAVYGVNLQPDNTSNVAPSYMSISADVQYTLLHRRTVHPWAARLLTRIVDLALRKVEARCDAPDLLMLLSSSKIGAIWLARSFAHLW